MATPEEMKKILEKRLEELKKKSSSSKEEPEAKEQPEDPEDDDGDDVELEDDDDEPGEETPEVSKETTEHENVPAPESENKIAYDQLIQLYATEKAANETLMKVIERLVEK